MNSVESIEDKLNNLYNIYKMASLPRPIEFLQGDASDIYTAQILLESRADEIKDLNKICDDLDKENGNLKERIAQQDVAIEEWRSTVRQLQDQLEKMRRETVHLDRVREVIFMLQFALEAAKRAYAMPMDVSAMLTAIWEQTRNELLYTGDDDIPF